MKRSERYLREAVNSFLQAGALVATAIVCASWGTSLMQDENIAFLPLYLAALVAIILIIPCWKEARRLLCLSDEWESHEHQKSIRPRI